MFKDWDAVKFVDEDINDDIKNAFVRGDICQDGKYLIWYEWRDTNAMGMFFFSEDELIIDEEPRGEKEAVIFRLR